MSDTLAFRPPAVPAPGDPSPGVADRPEADGRAGDRTGDGGVIRWLLVVAGVLLLAYALLVNRYWVPGGDSDFYVAIARSMARGQGFLYNGLPIQISPPGWPWVMAQVMRLSPTFLALKLTTLACMYGSLLVGYFVALRFLRPSSAALAVILAGLLMPVYSLTYFLHSEGLYCLLSAVALLLALRLREGRGRVVHTIALVGLCVAIPLTRWAGLLQLLPVAAVLVSGRPGTPWKTRHWKTALLCSLTVVATWATCREVLRLTPEQIKAVKAEGGIGSNETDIDETDLPASSDAKGPTWIPTETKHGFVYEYTTRFLRAGKWFSWLLWQPSRFVSISKTADVLVTLLGWGVIGMIGFLALVEARRGELLWLSLGLYTGGLCLGWDNPNSRYFVPVAALITTALLLAVRRAGEFWPGVKIDGWKWLRRGLVYSVLLTNLAMYGVDVIVMRSARFYSTFEAGQHKDLIAIAAYVMSRPPEPEGVASVPASLQWRPGDGDIMVNERYENLGRIRYSKASSRAMALLTDRFIKPLDYGPLSKVLKPDATSRRLARAVRNRRCEWLLIQAPAVPWRLWHFRLPDWLQDRLAKDKDKDKSRDVPHSGGWTLYHFQRDDLSFTEQPFASVDDWPTRVPGL